MTAGGAQSQPLLAVRGLKVHLGVGETLVRAVDGVDLRVEAGECVGIVGESGSGKSTVVRAITGLMPSVSIAELSGEITFNGHDLTRISPAGLRRLRGEGGFSMVFQDPLGYLNPTMRAGRQIAEALPAGLGRREARARVRELLREVGLPRPDLIARFYPHQLSGGMRQRVAIALALASSPALLFADEPTSSLDATVQLRVILTLLRLHRERNMALVVVTHDLGLIAELCDRVYVMRGGLVVEATDVMSLFDAPHHPYTASLIALSTRTGLDSASRSIPSTAKTR